MPRRRHEGRRFLATVLFTDIVGSTERAARDGDHAWRTLVEKHHATVRRELRAFDGREMDTAGDGFFAAFETPERAVRCAQAVVTAVAELGLQVRAGVHTGECEMVGSKVGGMTVVIAARIMALAGPGQVLVSGSVRDLMTGSGQTFSGGEPTALKGVTDQWRVYQATSPPGDVLADGHKRLAPLYTRRQRRRTLLAVAAVAALGLTAASVYVIRREAPAVPLGENQVGMIGPGGSPRVSRAIAVGRRPTAVAAGFGSIWVTNASDNSVSRVEPETGSSVPVTVGRSPSGIAVGAGAVWVANSGDSTVIRIDPETSRPTVIPVGNGPTGIAVAFGSVWVTNALDGTINEIDPDTNLAASPIDVGAGPTAIAGGEGYLWVTNQSDGTVTRFDPDTGARDEPIGVGAGPTGIAVADGAAWVANSVDGSLSRIDTEDLGVTELALDESGGPFGVAARGRDVWVSNEYAGTLTRVTSGRRPGVALTVNVRGAPLGVTFVDDDLWFANAAGGSAAHRGGTLRIAGTGIEFPAGNDPDVLDLTSAYDPASFRLSQLVNDGLVGLRRAPGAAGAEVVADLATAVPKPTDGGLTYTFHLRPGVLWSTGEPLVAGDIRRGIEHSIANVENGGGSVYYGVIRGGAKCTRASLRALGARLPRPACDLSAGITTDDAKRTVTFYLTRPTPEFLYQLALPSGSAVPPATPTELRPGQLLASLGPYLVHSYRPKTAAAGDAPVGHGRLEMVRNPHFRQWSPSAQPAGNPDRIVLETGWSEEEATAEVAAGRADLLWFDAPPSAADGLRARHASQVHTSDGGFVRYVFLNSTRRPFNNQAARRAVAFALDRQRLADLYNGPVTCQLVPPGSPGHRTTCPFTVPGVSVRGWNGPDKQRANALVDRSGTRGEDVAVHVLDYEPWVELGKRVAATLVGLGYDVKLTTQAAPEFFDSAYDPDNRFDVGVMIWAGDYLSASQYIVPLTGCTDGLGTFNLSYLCDRAHDTRLETVIAKQLTSPRVSSADWAALDDESVRAAATIPFSAEQHVVLVSKRVGDVPVSVLSGPLIAQLWVR